MNAIRMLSEKNTRAGTSKHTAYSQHTGWYGRCQESTDELSILVKMFVFASSSLLRFWN